MKYEYPDRPFGSKGENTTYRSLEADLKGKLVFEETDVGPWVDKHAPGADSDFETFSTIEDENLEKLLIELIKDKFEDHVAFRSWLEYKEIKYDFFCW